MKNGANPEGIRPVCKQKAVRCLWYLTAFCYVRKLTQLLLQFLQLLERCHLLLEHHLQR